MLFVQWCQCLCWRMAVNKKERHHWCHSVEQIPVAGQADRFPIPSRAGDQGGFHQYNLVKIKVRDKDQSEYSEMPWFVSLQ